MTTIWIASVIGAGLCVTAFLAPFGSSSSARQFRPIYAAGAGDRDDDAVQPLPDISQSKSPDCAAPLSQGPNAKVFAPAPRQDGRQKRHASRGISLGKGPPAISDSPIPTLQPDTAFCTSQAADRYRQIARDGGWPVIPGLPGEDASADDVQRLRRRLAAEGDLPESDASLSMWDQTLSDGVRRFQSRAGLRQSGKIDEATLKALNIPANVRAQELEASAKRLDDMQIQFGERYVVVNIPSAFVEAIDDSRVVQRHMAVAGRADRPSPQLSASIESVTLNPTWTIPRSIVEAEVIPKLKKDPRYLSRAKLVALDRNGREIRHIRWPKAASRFTFRQEPGARNALGRLRIDMPNHEEVYMHDTPEQRLFADNYRFLSHGCVRVEGVYDLASWLLSGPNSHQPWSVEAIANAVRDGRQKKLKLAEPVSVDWVYLDAWESADGVVHFAPDIYNLDGLDGVGAK